MASKIITPTNNKPKLVGVTNIVSKYLESCTYEDEYGNITINLDLIVRKNLEELITRNENGTTK